MTALVCTENENANGNQGIHQTDLWRRVYWLLSKHPQDSHFPQQLKFAIVKQQYCSGTFHYRMQKGRERNAAARREVTLAPTAAL